MIVRARIAGSFRAPLQTCSLSGYKLSRANCACQRPKLRTTRRKAGSKGNSTRHTGKSTSSARPEASTTTGLTSSRYTSAEYDAWSVNCASATRRWHEAHHCPAAGQEAPVPDELAILANALAEEDGFERPRIDAMKANLQPLLDACARAGEQ